MKLPKDYSLYKVCKTLQFSTKDLFKPHLADSGANGNIKIGSVWFYSCLSEKLAWLCCDTLCNPCHLSLCAN